MQSSGGLLYGIASVESCDGQAVIHFAQATEPAKRWSILADIEAPVLDLSFLNDLNFDCGCTTAAGFSSLSMGWLAMALVRTRRRRKKGAKEPSKKSDTPAG